ncbi:hypothetical protein F511_28131 [Dorcoceras hygrometricum]|uniref:Uncharacterized protein n=1 Tax=Dorcoceras hygrometricum TaxID=472368 RepID=A0A2Z7BI15_9LAMI|nr:hypothetical protein F511_28131 [Dorcoceras hygrometricum]
MASSIYSNFSTLILNPFSAWMTQHCGWAVGGNLGGMVCKSFELPVDGLGDLSEIPKDAIFDARSIVSLSGEPAITVEKFSLITAVVCSLRMNWAKILFSIFKNMVTPGSKKAKGFAIQISLLLANIPNLELGASSEFPASKILTKKTVHRFVSINSQAGAEEVFGASKPKEVSTKRPTSDVVAAVTKKRRTSKRILTLETVVVAQEAVPIQSIPVSTAVEPMVEDQQAESSTEQPAGELPANKSAASIEERHWFDLSYEELIAKWAAERPITSPGDSYDEIKDDNPVVDDPDTIINHVLQNLDSTSDDKNVEPVEEAATLGVVTAGEDQQVQEFFAQNANDDLIDDDEQKSLEDILLEIPFDVPLPSAGMEITKIVMGQTIKIPGVTEKTWFLNSLPSIPDDHKGKTILVEKDPIMGNPAQEHFFLICADIDLLVALRAKVIDDVALFFNSFSLKKLATINIDEMYKKEEHVLSWGETESPQVAIQRKSYILLKGVDKDGTGSWSYMEKDVLSTMFEGSPRDRGAVIARTNTNTRSSSWIRTMILVDGVWTVEPCADKWVKIPRQVISNEVHRQRQYDDTLPTVSEFFRLMRKRWADVCLEVVEFCASQRLLPIGSLQFCRSSSVVGPVFQDASRHSPIFSFRVSQFFSIFVDFSLFNWFPSADISDFLSSIALERTDFRDVQRSFAQTVVPSVQFSLDQRPYSPISSDSSSSLHFDVSDVDATASSLPPVSQDFSAALADLQAILSDDQAAILKNLSQEARQEGRSIDDVQTMRLNEFRKNILAQNASIFVGLADVRKEVQEVNAKVDIMASRLNAIQKDAEATKEALSHQLFEFQSQAQENHSILHAQLSEIVDYIHRGGADKKGESGSRGLQQPSNVQIEGSAVRPTFAQRVEMAQRHIVHTVLDADANRELLERQAAAERDRERRRR